jgi:hypothetical protein
MAEKKKSLEIILLLANNDFFQRGKSINGRETEFFQTGELNRKTTASTTSTVC